MKKQSGSAHIIIIAAMTILLIGMFGFIFWQNFIHKPGESNKTVSNVSKTTGSNIKASEPVEEKGTIVGMLTYPSEGIPSWVEVHATNLQTKEDFVTKDHLSGSQYKTGLATRFPCRRAPTTSTLQKAMSGHTMTTSLSAALPTTTLARMPRRK
jgi:hypothetical protein